MNSRATILILGGCFLAACGGPRRVNVEVDASALPAPDASAPRDASDGGVELDAEGASGRDASQDVRQDAGPSADSPAPRDVSSEGDAPGGVDVPDRSSPDAGDRVDGSLDAAPDAPPDAALDAAPDEAPDEAPDAALPWRPCPLGMRPVGEACVPFLPLDPPRPIAPPAFNRVTSHRPTFEWELAPGAEGARVEICGDRACARVLTTFDATGTSGRPATALPRGVLWWRLRARAGGSRGTVASEPWSVVVTARDVPLDTFHAVGFDHNGDGYADGVSARSAFYGGSGGPYRVQQLAEAAEWGPPEPAHDLNGDGYADVLTCRRYSSQCAVYHGGPDGLRWGGSLRLPEGYCVVGCGDVDHDGYADLMILTSGPTGGRVEYYRGGPFGVATTPWRTVPARGRRGDIIGDVWRWESLGDMDGDRRPDTVLHTFSIWTRSFVVVAFGVGDFLLYTSAPDHVTLMAPAGDVNGDGFADLFSAIRGRDGPDSGIAFLALGAPGGIGARDFPWVPPHAPYWETAFGVGDFDGDGVGDYVSSGRLVLSTRATVTGPFPAFGLSLVRRCVGDLNGDGYDDALSPESAVALGGPTGLGPSTPVTVRP